MDMLNKTIRDTIQVVVLALVIFVMVRVVVQNHIVEGVSMEPSVHDGQVIMVSKMAYWFETPQRGDIVVFHFPRNRDQDFIKRVIGLPGDTIEIREGETYIDGYPLDESFLEVRPSSSLPSRQIPQGHYFVMGDNRNNSYDSRAWGTVPCDDIVGQAWFNIWPLDELGPAPNSSLATGPP